MSQPPGQRAEEPLERQLDQEADPNVSRTKTQTAIGVPDDPDRRGRRRRLVLRIRELVRAINEDDEQAVDRALRNLSQSRRYLAPLGFVVGAFTMLFQGVRLLFSNWRLTLIQVLPAMWIWLAMLDLKVHALHGKSFSVLRGPVIIPLIIVIAAITVMSFYLNAVFAFSIATRGRPKIRPAFVQARSHLQAILFWGLSVGLCLGVATIIFPRWGRWWFSVSLSIVVGVMMLTYVALPSRLVGRRATVSRRDALTATVVGGALGAAICTPPYALGRLGILMLGSGALFVPGIAVIVVALPLQAGATGAVKAIKMSAKLVAHPTEPPPGDGSSAEPMTRESA